MPFNRVDFGRRLDTPAARENDRATLSALTAAFINAGGEVTRVKGFTPKAAPPRSTKLDPEANPPKRSYVRGATKEAAAALVIKKFASEGRLAIRAELRKRGIYASTHDITRIAESCGVIIRHNGRGFI